MSLKEFQIQAKLGEGAYSSVYRVRRNSDGQEYALKKVKLMNLSDKEKQNALNEVRILASIRQPNIVGYKEAFLDEMSNSLCIVMEYANNGDLFQKICEYQKKGQLFPEQEIWSIFIQVVKGLKALHDLKIFHRDLKSANVFMSKDGTVKLGDMNVSKVAKKGLLYTQTGTPYYASPEVWKDQPYDNKSDIWSLGCVLYEMTTLKPPFRAEDMEGLYKKVIRGYYPRIPPHYSQDLNNVIRALLQVAPHLRPTSDKILQLPALQKKLGDNYFTEVDEGVPFLLNTIRIPKNLHYLTDRLPKPNYQPLKTKKIDRQRFMQTLAGYKDQELQQINEVEQNTSSPEQSGSNSANKQVMLPKIPQKKPTHRNNYSKNHKEGEPSEKEKESDNSSIFTEQISQIQPKQYSKKILVQKREYDQINKNINAEDSLIINKVSDQSNIINKNQDLKKLLDIQGLKYENPQLLQNKPQQQLQSQNDKSQMLAQIYNVKPIKKKYNVNSLNGVNGIDDNSLTPIKHKVKKYPNILDIEGEPKPLLNKQRKIPSIHNSQQNLYDDDQLSKLPKINNENKLPPLLNMNQNSKQINEKDSMKIREISKAYKVNMGQLDELKDKYKQLKKLEKKEKTPGNKNMSLGTNSGQLNDEQISQKYVNYASIGGENDENIQIK